MDIGEVSTWSITRLDVSTFKGETWHRTGCLDLEHAFKSTALGLPLGIRNCHAERIHLAWMHAELKRFWMVFF